MTTYLSPAIQNELIELFGKKVKDLILEEIKTAKYFSILLDSTPDVSHIDQMAFIVRYVKIDSNNEVQIKESGILSEFLSTARKKCRRHY